MNIQKSFLKIQAKYKNEKKLKINNFLEVFSTYVISNIENKCEVNNTVKHSIETNVKEDLFNLIAKTIILEAYIYNLEVPNSKMSDFIREYLYNKDFRNKINTIYPYLCDRVINRSNILVDSYTEMFLNIEKDKEELVSKGMIEKDSELSKVIRGSGDSHNNGRQVTELVFNNSSIYYKPKISDTTTALFKLQKWIQKKSEIKFNYFSILNKEGYSYESKVPHIYCENENDIDLYYYNLGIVIGLLYILNGTDYHQENVIANSIYPVMIDNETLLSPAFENKSVEFQVKHSGILPNNENKIDFSVLSAPYSDQYVDLEGINNENDVWFVEKRQYKLSISNSHPAKHITYKKIVKEQKSNILKGVRKILEFIIKEKNNIIKNDLLSDFNNIKTRVVIRYTQRYAEILNKLYHPDNIKTIDNAVNFLEENLNKNSLTFIIEKEQLLNGDIPIFHMNTNECFLLENDKWKLCDNTPYNQIVEKVKNLTFDEISIIEKHIENILKTKDEKHDSK
ncbi:DUF4135 domain-containing protein [Staphylococcus pseudintermedius]|nr:DUF4135 domain-containing protein [Staphylococcus pseudintermedius]EGQ3539127.1 DUF4135 domain-containing protein [Staphylococcus pseudintermedius]EGQ3973926.1 hypothetical protein [Staphylococcus pseudintermedius]EJD5716309.1 DUF4135 domain-containing protein [Staphylococcus pseudintermedius]EJD5776491.1 DUF4135 domain-containing protein [Staphylococcus pseudintermedius]